MKRESFIWRYRHRSLHLDQRTAIMGILNMTPDSFYSASRLKTVDFALRRAEQMIAAGVDILDVGGESSRPGAQAVTLDEELGRVIPIVHSLRQNWDTPISIDTVRAEVARQALQEGADIVNDISGLTSDARMGAVVAESEAGVVLMHMRGVPRNMQVIPASQDILKELHQNLAKALERATEAGIHRDRIVLDPGIGFGKTGEDNLVIINRLQVLQDFELPILLGTSRKSFIGQILGVPASERLWGTAASVAVSIIKGAHIVRVHDVAEMRMVVTVTDALLNEEI